MFGNARRKLTTGLLVVSLVLSYGTASAAAGWYGGKIEYIYLSNNGFFVGFIGSTVDDCQYKRIWVKESTLGVDTVNRAYSMALAAQAAGRSLTIVVDKAVNGPGGLCEALNGSMTIKD